MFRYLGEGREGDRGVREGFDQWYLSNPDTWSVFSPLHTSLNVKLKSIYNVHVTEQTQLHVLGISLINVATSLIRTRGR